MKDLFELCNDAVVTLLLVDVGELDMLLSTGAGADDKSNLSVSCVERPSLLKSTESDDARSGGYMV